MTTTTKWFSFKRKRKEREKNPTFIHGKVFEGDRDCTAAISARTLRGFLTAGSEMERRGPGAISIMHGRVGTAGSRSGAPISILDHVFFLFPHERARPQVSSRDGLFVSWASGRGDARHFRRLLFFFTINFGKKGKQLKIFKKKKSNSFQRITSSGRAKIGKDDGVAIYPTPVPCVFLVNMSRFFYQTTVINFFFFFIRREKRTSLLIVTSVRIQSKIYSTIIIIIGLFPSSSSIYRCRRLGRHIRPIPRWSVSAKPKSLEMPRRNPKVAIFREKAGHFG